ncbi:hypothetical protein ACFV84_02805 [Kitasatospora sp. NPDC059811]|uniref:hypothetical protein n=1 Tax=Streptomycetaceae TaxID=2062 RepID=UPI0007AFA11B|nr:hypothetical protein [Streptomyces sp. MJM8645]
MAKLSNPMARVRSIAPKTAAVVGVSALALLGFMPAAQASSGTSSTVLGCYSTWGNTGTSAHCFNVTLGGRFQNFAACNVEADKYAYISLQQGSTASDWGQLNCTWKIDYSSVSYLG